jgi:hypothetical protein
MTEELRAEGGLCSPPAHRALEPALEVRGGGEVEAAGQADGGSDRFVDALIAWGDEAAIRRRAREHLNAGATRILAFDFNPRPESELLPAVAPGVEPEAR